MSTTEKSPRPTDASHTFENAVKSRAYEDIIGQFCEWFKKQSYELQAPVLMNAYIHGFTVSPGESGLNPATLFGASLPEEHFRIHFKLNFVFILHCRLCEELRRRHAEGRCSQREIEQSLSNFETIREVVERFEAGIRNIPISEYRQRTQDPRNTYLPMDSDYDGQRPDPRLFRLTARQTAAFLEMSRADFFRKSEEQAFKTSLGYTETNERNGRYSLEAVIDHVIFTARLKQTEASKAATLKS